MHEFDWLIGPLPAIYLSALIATVALETALACTVVSRIRNNSNKAKASTPLSAIALLVAGVNLLTHPLAWFCWSSCILNYWLAEAAVVLIEAMVFWVAFQNPLHSKSYSPFSIVLAISSSLALNMATASVGWMV